MKKMRIVIPIWRLGKEGGQRVLANLANEWKKQGYHVLFLCHEKTIAPYYPVNCEIKYVNWKGNGVERSDAKPAKNRVQQAISFVRTYYALKNGMKKVKNEYDVAIANYSLTAYAVTRSGIKNKFYYIQAYEAWETENQNIYLKIFNYSVRKTYGLPLIRIVNANIYKSYKEIHSDYVIPPGLDMDLYYPKSEYWNRRCAITVGCIGREEEWKGSSDVAKAVELLQENGVDVNFKVAFNPVKCSKYELVMPDGDECVSDFYRHLDILVAPGKLQLGAIHYPVIEAMACGTPVITTGYYPANNENAYIVPVSKPEEIARTIIYISENYDEAIYKAKNALKEIRRFDWKIVSKDFLKIVDSNI